MTETPSQFAFQAIGFLESCYKDKFGVPRQSGLVQAATAKLKIRGDLQPESALQGLEGFSHLWLIWVFHENKSSRYHAKVHPPRLKGLSTGVFSTRSPHRPNPIGLSLVEVVAVEGDTLFLTGVDLMDGTPVLDLKPYLPGVESKAGATEGWSARAEEPQIKVIWSAEAERAIPTWMERLKDRERRGLKDLIEQTIRQDPRPLLYRGDPGSPEFNRRVNHAFRLYDGDVHFRMIDEKTAEVFAILEMHHEFPAMNLHRFAASSKPATIERTEGSHGDNHESSQ